MRVFALKEFVLGLNLETHQLIYNLISATKQKTLFWQKKSINMVNFERFSGLTLKFGGER